MMTKMNSSYMHTRYSYLCVWTYEEESSNETISLGQYIDRRFKVLFIDYHTGTILLYAFFSIHSSHENEPLLWGYVYLLLARNSFPRFFRILSLFPLYYPSVNSIIVIFQTLGRSIFGEVFLVEIKWKDLVSHILVGNVQHSFQKKDVNDYEWLDEATCNNISFLFLCGSLKKKRHWSCLNIICFQRYYGHDWTLVFTILYLLCSMCLLVGGYFTIYNLMLASLILILRYSWFCQRETTSRESSIENSQCKFLDRVMYLDLQSFISIDINSSIIPFHWTCLIRVPQCTVSSITSTITHPYKSPCFIHYNT